ncbi:DUF4160 domain-containing protein [Aquimarina sp. 2304DJ70-9]|uniref:DUF4160 domain-containing protein n=1 Tax=Aquimarina penaris TaxID=3231044 RepID=UPI003462CF18
MIELLEQELSKFINRTLYNPEWGVYFIKEQVGQVRNMKIEIYSNDHNPPHFHVKSKDGSINAVFRLDNCELIKGTIQSKDRKRIEAFYDDEKVKVLLKSTWNKSKGDNLQID